MRKIIAIFILTISGCATSITAPKFKEAPSPEMQTDMAVLYIYRKFASPLTSSAYLYLNDQKVASLLNEGFTWIYVPSGNQKLKYSWSIFAAMPTVEFEFSFVAGKLYAFEMIGQASPYISQSKLKPVPYEEATVIIESCCRYVSLSED